MNTSAKVDQLRQLISEKIKNRAEKKEIHPDKIYEFGPPNEFALLKQGDVVIDLGSGDGTECFEARTIVGDGGRVIGIEADEALVELANQSVHQSGDSNVEFFSADFESLPLKDNLADVVISNRLLHRVKNKESVFSEIHRVLKKHGHFNITDIVSIGKLPDTRRKQIEEHLGLTQELVEISDYLNFILGSRFTGLRISKGKRILLPSEFMDEEDMKNEFISGAGIFTVTFFAEKS